MQVTGVRDTGKEEGPLRLFKDVGGGGGCVASIQEAGDLETCL